MIVPDDIGPPITDLRRRGTGGEKRKCERAKLPEALSWGSANQHRPLYRDRRIAKGKKKEEKE